MAGGNVGGYYNKRHPKSKKVIELQETLHVIWDSLLQGPIDKAVQKFRK